MAETSQLLVQPADSRWILLTWQYCQRASMLLDGVGGGSVQPNHPGIEIFYRSRFKGSRSDLGRLAGLAVQGFNVQKFNEQLFVPFQ